MSSWVFDDGGRAAAGYRGDAGDCVPRAVAIATGLGYVAVYDALSAEIDLWLTESRSRQAAEWRQSGRPATPRNGTPMPVLRSLLQRLGWIWTPTMAVGAGTTVHLRAGELPGGRLIVRCSRHVVAVVDGVVHDTHDPARDGTRAVYGYWSSGSGSTGAS